MLLGALERRMRGASLPVRAAAGSGVITAVELITGSLFNRQYQVWDYRPLPLNYKGQICMGFSLLWMPLSLGAMTLYRKLWR